MENAVDALKMAFGVMVFVLALSISIISFGQARQTAQYIIEMKDRESDAIGNESYYIVEKGKERTVGVETIVPALYRAYHEQYIVAFEWKKQEKYIWDIWTEDKETNIYNYKPSNIIELNSQTVRSESNAIELITELLKKNGNLSRTETVNGNEISVFGKNYKNHNGQSPNLYSKLKEKKFIEKQGIFYDEDTWGELQEDETATGTETPEINKTKRKIIIYKEK